MKINSSNKQKLAYLNRTWSDFKDTVVNRALLYFAYRGTWIYAYSPFKKDFFLKKINFLKSDTDSADKSLKALG